jgi:hypothetical protein
MPGTHGACVERVKSKSEICPFIHLTRGVIYIAHKIRVKPQQYKRDLDALVQVFFRNRDDGQGDGFK